MKRIHLVLTACLLLTAQFLMAQRFFQFVTPERATSNATDQSFSPKQKELEILDLNTLSTLLANAPMEFSATVDQQPATIAFPMADGSFEDFQVWRIMSCEQAIYDKYPEIRTFAGRSLKDPKRTLRGSITMRGLRVFIYESDFKVSRIQPLQTANRYRVYRQDDMPKSFGPAIGQGCGVDHAAFQKTLEAQESHLPLAQVEERGVVVADEAKLRTYRFVVGCNYAFVADHGGTKELAFAAIVEYVNAIGAVYERDVAIRLQLQASSENVVFVAPTIQLPEGANAAQILQNSTFVINSFVQPENYDIGHILSKHIGDGLLGIASLNSICTQNKGSGSSSGNLPTPSSTDYGVFFLNTFAHEAGHQHGGGHTWNHCGSNEGGRASDSAYEPGGGSTIMGYAGICGSDDYVTGTTYDFVFHSGSIQQMKTFTTLGTGNTCGVVTMDGNLNPELSLPYTNGFMIPKNTPFELTGSATDDPNQTLSYSWENIQLGDYTPLQTQLGDSPAFRSFMPTDVPNRVFPRMPLILSNQTSVAEQLANYGRNYAFRFTVRDGHPAHPGLAWKDVSFKSTDAAGPFRVMSPNIAAESWQSGTYTEVIWDVANSDQPPVNCQFVNIRLSTDGGLTWPITLATNVENDGIQSVLVPSQLTNTARVRVDAADNIFFDVSNANFKIVAPTQPGLTTGISQNFSFICLPNDFTATIFSAGALGFNNTVSVSVLGQIPPGAVLNLSKSTMNPGETSTLSLDMANVVITDTFSFIVRTLAAGAGTTDFPVTIITKTNDFSTLALQTPVDGGVNLSQSQILRWSKSADALNYDVQLATDPTFAPGSIVTVINKTTLDSLKVPVILEKSTAYYWRIRPNNICSPHPWSEPFFFSTLTESCASFEANDLPKGITGNSPTTVESIINIGQGGAVSEISVKNITGFHDFFGDLDVRLVSPQGTEVILFKNRCTSYSGTFNLGLDDSAPTSFTCPPSNTGNITRAQGSFSALSGQSSEGNWTLKVRDTQASSGGQLEKFELDFCAAVNLNAPFLVNNIPIQVPTGTNVPVPSLNLLCEDLDNSAAELTYTLLTIPAAGELILDGLGVLKVGDQFTQSDINNGFLRYFDFGFGNGVDCFRFVVADGTGGFLGTPSFCFQPTGVATNELNPASLQFKVQPNPATDAVWVVASEVFDHAAQIRVWSLTGQLLSEATLPQGQEKMQILTGAFPRGVYVIEMATRKGNAVQRVVLR